MHAGTASVWAVDDVSSCYTRSNALSDWTSQLSTAKREPCRHSRASGIQLGDARLKTGTTTQKDSLDAIVLEATKVILLLLTMCTYGRRILLVQANCVSC
jgi:NADH:ubiquinone oxidoreductase subunit F (NADH-binding)